MLFENIKKLNSKLSSIKRNSFSSQIYSYKSLTTHLSNWDVKRRQLEHVNNNSHNSYNPLVFGIRSNFRHIYSKYWFIYYKQSPSNSVGAFDPRSSWVGNKYSSSSISGGRICSIGSMGSFCPWYFKYCRTFQYYHSSNNSRGYRIYFSLEKR